MAYSPGEGPVPCVFFLIHLEKRDQALTPFSLAAASSTRAPAPRSRLSRRPRADPLPASLSLTAPRRSPSTSAVRPLPPSSRSTRGPGADALSPLQTSACRSLLQRPGSSTLSSPSRSLACSRPLRARARSAGTPAVRPPFLLSALPLALRLQPDASHPYRERHRHLPRPLLRPRDQGSLARGARPGCVSSSLSSALSPSPLS